MTGSRTLQPEDQVAHYRVVGPLGAGGMGEVYLAQDQTLERNVALKVLPPELVRSEERVRRFVQEAKSASSLNHPNIITIYEIGQDTVKSASGEASSGSVQFISMELVSGKTLGAKIHDEKTDLRTLLGYMAQSAEGIAKAHAAGIVHRDLKPGNIMISDDGFAKVLDFGLAKLTEKRGGDASATAMTEVAERTAEGAVLGTVFYMSPEQVQGKSVDHRSDIFSFGCILYEAATRLRPFVAESNVETMHKILHDKPQPIEEINASVPAELRRLIRRCMNKSADQRLQSMKDVALELREIVDEYDSLSASATSATVGSGGMPAVSARPGRRLPLVPVIALGTVVIAAALFFGLRGGGKGPAEEPHPFQNMRFSTETSRGDVNDCILSPDGRYLAYVVAEQGQIGMFVRQVATGSDVPVIPLAKDRIEMPRFSPDGNYLFYLGRKPDAPLYRTLFRIASLGGTPEERAFDVDSRVSFSPDGKQFAFVRGFPQDGRTGIFVMDADGTNERELASVKSPEEIASGVEWSPDGKSIATLTVQPPPQSSSTLVLFDVKSGQRSDVTARKQAFYNGLAWMGDASAVVVTGNDLTMGFTRQAFLISVPGGQVRRVTNDFNQYDSPSVTASSDAIALIRGTYLANLWSVDPAGGANAQVTRATSSESSPWNFGTADGAVVYAALRDQALKLFVNPLPDGEPRVINTGPGHAIQIRSRARMVAFAKYNEGEQHLWCVGLDGSGLRQLTNFGGEDLLDISPDGRLVAFSRADSASGVWLVPTDGGEPRVVSRTAIKGVAAFSEDGNWLGYAEYDRSGGLIRTAYYKMTLATGEISPPLNAPPQAVILRWLPDQSGYCYSDRADPAGNIFRASFDGSEPVRMTDFKDMRITDFDFSPDGKQMAIVRWLGNTENVWVANADGSNPRQVTTFASQVIFGMRWMANPMRVIVTAGDAARDVVMIREFK